MKYLKKLLLSMLVFSSVLHAQNSGTTLKGKVTGKDNLGLAGVTVMLKGTVTATQTDAEGNYSLKVTAASGTLVFTSVGYALKEMGFSAASSTLDVKMEESISVLNEVVLTGYIKQKKSDITGAIASVRNKEFRDQPVSNVAQSIQGKLSGVLVTQASGTPGAGLSVFVRGSSNPLYVVDGIPMISESNSSLSTSYNTDGEEVGKGQNVSSISDINPDDIESIEVLKDASSASVYGARAANGVVLITTKRGKNGKTDFGFNSFTGIQTLAKNIPFLDSKGFIELTEDARAQDYKLYQQNPDLFGEDFDPAILTNPLPSDWNTGVNTDWLSEIFRSAPLNNLQLSARGGNDKTKFFVAGNYFDQQGIVIENYYRRGTFRANIDNKVSDKVSIGATTSFSYSRNRRSFNDNTYTGIVTNAIGASPLEPVYDADGNYSDYTLYQASWLSDNPIKSAKEIVAYTSSYRFLGSVFADIDLVKNLQFRSSYSVDYSNLTDDQFFSPITTDAVAVSGRAQKGIYRNTTWLNENTLTYQNVFHDKHSLTALGGFTVQSSKTNQSFIKAQGFPIGSGLQNISSASSITAAGDFNTGWGLVSLIGRANYAYDDKYLFSLSARYDGSSRFNPSGRWGFFPAMSAGWILTREKFLENSKWLTNLKLRVSYGLTGDQEIGNFQYLGYWSPVRYDGYSGLSPRNFANPDLTWQTNEMGNIGLDFEILKGKFSGSVEFFASKRKRLLAEAVLPATSGFRSVTINRGAVRNDGLEFSLNAYIIRNKNFNWNASFNISYVKNRIVSLYSDNELISAYNDLFSTHILKIGEAIGSFWGIEYLGVDPDTGDPMYEDLNKDGAIDESDSKVLGQANPKMFGGLTNDFRYKNWDMSIVTQFSAGNKIYNLIRATYQTLGWSDEGWDEEGNLYQVYANNATIVNKRWRNPGDKTDIPRASLVFQNYLQNSSQFLENASFFRIRTVNLGYTIRPKNKKMFTSLRVYAQVQNLHVFTKYYGFDPEVSSTGGDSEETAGVDYAAYPQSRTYTFGINFNF